MLRLTLVRHAKSSWSSPGQKDFDRPLNERGYRDLPLMAERVRQLGRLPDRLVSSPALRALTTARGFAEVLGRLPDEVELRSAIYDASVETLFDVVRALPAATRNVMLFGHNPGFSEFANALATCPFEQMPTCAVASLELQIGQWRELGPGCGRLAQFLYPKDGTD